MGTSTAWRAAGRAAQVYLEPHQLGVAPLLTSWLAGLPAHYPVSHPDERLPDPI